MKNNIFFTALVVVIGLTSCGDNTWSDANKERFVKDCIANDAPAKYCECMVNKLAEKYPDVPSAQKAMEDDNEATLSLGSECL